MEKLEDKQLEAYNLALAGHNLLITGQCGTGKSHTVKQIANALIKTGKKVSITATSGISSIIHSEFKATTIHHWAGLKDGRFGKDQLVDQLLNNESFAAAKHRIISCDVSVIDEIGMMSLKIFEDLEHAVRTIRGLSSCFGGMQVIGCGSFKQLAPVPNKKYNDDGTFCFNSNYFDLTFPHKIKLTSVKRTNNNNLIKAVNELCEGNLSSGSHKFIKSLSRPIDHPSPTRLFSTNLDCAFYNHELLTSDEGDIQIFRSVDTGRKSALLTVKTPKVLVLKEDCPVILTCNYDNNLVNGLQGKIFSLPNNNSSQVVVNFNDKLHIIQKKQFDIFDPAINKNSASRTQYPLSLAYALTMHRVQGQTLDNVIVDCSGVFKAGQLGVALGRASCVEGLQVINFSPSQVLRHPPEVYAFDKRASLPVKDDYECCNKNDLFPELEISTADNSTNFLQIPFVPTSSPIEVETPHQDHDYVIASPTVELVRDKLTLYFNDTQFNQDGMDDENLKHFINSVTLLAEQSASNRDKGIVYSFFNSENGIRLRKNLFNVDSLNQMHAKVSFKIIYICLDLVYENVANKIVLEQSNKIMCSLSNTSESCTGDDIVVKEKIMYLAGNAVHRVKQACTRKLKSGISSKKTVVNNRAMFIKQKLLTALRITEIEALYGTNSAYLGEIVSKQTSSRGLTYVKNNVFHFFFDVYSKLGKFNKANILEFHQESIFSQMYKYINGDTKLLNQWYEICESLQLEISSITDVELFLSDIVLDVFEQLTWYFTKVCGIDFINQYKEKKRKKGKKALRVEVNKCAAKSVKSSSSTNVTYCGECKIQCLESPKKKSDESIQCDRCSFWYHYHCENISGKENFITNPNTSWFCNGCKLILK